MIFSWLQNNWLEASGLLTGLLYVYFAINENRILWLFWVISSVLYFFVFRESRFYAGMLLQIYYLVAGIMGWISWSKPESSRYQISFLNRQFYLLYIAIILILWVIIAVILIRYSDSAVAWSDGLAFSISVVASYLLVIKKIENWILWFFVNIIYISLFVSQQFWLTSLLYLVFLIMAISGFIEWNKIIKYQLFEKDSNNWS
jgi:nicotinamide mononucleotide transporter